MGGYWGSADKNPENGNDVGAPAPMIETPNADYNCANQMSGAPMKDLGGPTATPGLTSTVQPVNEKSNGYNERVAASGAPMAPLLADQGAKSLDALAPGWKQPASARGVAGTELDVR